MRRYVVGLDEYGDAFIEGLATVLHLNKPYHKEEASMLMMIFRDVLLRTICYLDNDLYKFLNSLDALIDESVVPAAPEDMIIYRAIFKRLVSMVAVKIVRSTNPNLRPCRYVMESAMADFVVIEQHFEDEICI